MNAIDLAQEGVWTDALSIASQGFLAGAVAAVIAAGGGGASARRRMIEGAEARVAAQNAAVLAAILAFMSIRK